MLHGLKTAPKIGKQNVIVVVIAILLVTISITGLAAYIFIGSVNCNKVLANANSLIKQSNYKQAYNTLEPDAKTCVQVSGQTSSQSQAQTKVRAVQYNETLATTAYANGDYAPALQYAQAAVKLNKTLPAGAVPYSQVEAIQMICILDHEDYR